MNKLLIVEDDAFINRTYSRLFVCNGYEVLSAHSAIDALDILNKEKIPPSVIILDVNLPGMDGRTFLEKIKKDDTLKSVPIVILTNSVHEDEKKFFFDLGVDLFLIKIKVNNNDLVNSIKGLVDRSKSSK